MQHPTWCVRLCGTTTMLAFVAYSLKPVNILAQQVPTFLLFCDRRCVAQQCYARLHGTTTMLRSWKRLQKNTSYSEHCLVTPRVFSPRFANDVIEEPLVIHALVFPWCFVFFSSEITSPMAKMARQLRALCRFIVQTTCKRKRKNGARRKAYKEQRVRLLYQNASLLWTTANTVGSFCIHLHALRNKCNHSMPTIMWLVASVDGPLHMLYTRVITIIDRNSTRIRTFVQNPYEYRFGRLS